jgi:hypothetical protein
MRCRIHVADVGAAIRWIMFHPQGWLRCLTVYKRGAVEVVRRLAG